MLCALYLAIGLEASFVKAADKTDNSVPTAALRLQQDSTHDLRDQVVRCQLGEKVGIWVESRSYLTLVNVVVEDCEVGIVVIGGTSTNVSKDAALGVTPPSSVHLENVRVRATTIGIFLTGSGSIVSNNIVGGAKYGIVVTGDDNTITGNRSNGNIKDGFLVTGDRNLLEGNEARRNGGVGIHVASMVPMVGKRQFLSFIQDRGLGNIIRGNVALDNKRDLVEFAEDCEDEGNYEGEGNNWINNTFKTRRPKCIE
jgi:parallel beta-helix repeat protein